MVWWGWLVAGAIIGALELVLPGHIFLGFAIGAVTVGAVEWSGLVAIGLPMQLLIFAVVALAAWAGLRAAFPLQRGEVKRWTRDIND
ncbi:NfeD family protein [Gemmobacter serpentinus]|uniref:NfeD family protein n=1 Tax=Gemmobacter serpentinus TaxID=2652247 RepID=UPI001CF6B6C7|nr:hypothetical protein [Gemmobacter serpentinus]